MWQFLSEQVAYRVKHDLKSSLQGYNPYFMLMSPNEDKPILHDCHCLGDMAVCMRIGKILARP